MRKWGGVRWIVAAIGFALLAACEDPVSGPQDIQAVSSVALDHFHRTTIPARDVDSPPAGGRTYVSTLASDHTHGVQLSEQQLRDLQQPGAVVGVTSLGPSAGAAHTHVFTFER